MGPNIGGCFGGIYLSMLLLWALKQVMSSYTELINTQPPVISNTLTIVCIVLHVILKLFVWDFSHIVNNWLAAVWTPSLSNHYRTNETNISMDISKCFSLWKEQAKNARGASKVTSLWTMMLFNTVYEPKRLFATQTRRWKSILPSLL